MGNYARTLERIEELENRLTQTDDPEELAEIQMAIGENKGYLEELASMDGYSSYNEMLYKESHFEINK